MSTKKYFSLFLLIIVISTCKTAEAQKVLAKIGKAKVQSNEFLYIYNKNNSNTTTITSKKEYFDLYVNFKLKVEEAKLLGLDTTKAFIEEFGNYKKQLTQPYLSDKSQIDYFIQEAYERLKSEVSAAHILINVAPDATPEDSLKAFEKISSIRALAMAGENFAALALKHSQDPSAKFNNGLLGYFTSMQMVYPFESAAYNTKVGEISNPVRTQFGYHIIKVNDKRPSNGQYKVAHIMLKAYPGIDPKDSIKIKAKAEEIYSRLQSGADWNEMVRLHSEDQNSKNNDGILDWFGVGGLIPAFEEAAFTLKNKGDITKPIQTPYGWHVIKLIDQKSIEPFEAMVTTIKSRVNRDSRAQASHELYLNKLKKDHQFSEFTPNVKSILAKSDSLPFYKMAKDKNSLKQPLFSIAKKTVKTADFYEYLSVLSSDTLFKIQASNYKNFVEKKLMELEAHKLYAENFEYRMLLNEYHDGILLFQLMDEKVWTQAIQDSVGLYQFYLDNKSKYINKEMAEGAMLDLANNEAVTYLKDSVDFEKLLADKNYTASVSNNLNTSNPLNANLKTGIFNKAEIMIGSEINWVPGHYIHKAGERIYYIYIKNIIEENTPEFEDIKGQVISDYQTYLENKWLIELRSKIPVKINSSELNKILKS